MTENKRFWSEDYSVGYYTEIVDNDKELTDVPNPKKNLTIEEVVDLLNELNDEIKKLRTLNYVNKEAVRLNCIKTVKIGNNDVDCSNIDWELLYELYGAMIDYYYEGDVEMTENKRYSDGSLAKWYYSRDYNGMRVISNGVDEFTLNSKKQFKDINYKDLKGTNQLLDELNRLENKIISLKKENKELKQINKENKRFTYKYGKLFDNNYNTFYSIEDSEENIELFCNRLNKLNNENYELIQFKEQVFNLIDKKLEENKELDSVDTAMYYANKQTLNELKKELKSE